MPTFEILRDDDVVVFQEALTRQELESDYLLELRSENKENSYTVFKLDDDLVRIGTSKNYIPYSEDKDIPIKSVFHNNLFSDLLNTFNMRGLHGLSGLSDGELPELIDEFGGDEDE